MTLLTDDLSESLPTFMLDVRSTLLTYVNKSVCEGVIRAIWLEYQTATSRFHSQKTDVVQYSIFLLQVQYYSASSPFTCDRATRVLSFFRMVSNFPRWGKAAECRQFTSNRMTVF